MARILLIYGTAYGQTERIARRIADQLAAHGHAVCMYQGDRLPRRLPVDQYEGYLVAGSIIRGRHQGYIRDFARRFSSRLNSAPSAFVSVSGAAASSPQEAREYMGRFLQETGWRPAHSACFAGSMAFTKYAPLLRWIMKKISARREGPTDTTRDHEMTDWQAVDRFAEKLAAELSSSPMADQAENLLLGAAQARS